MTPSSPPRHPWLERLKGLGLFAAAFFASGLGATLVITVFPPFGSLTVLFFFLGLAWYLVKEHFGREVMQGFYLGALLATLLVATCFGLVFWNFQMH